MYYNELDIIDAELYSFGKIKKPEWLIQNENKIWINKKT